MFARIAANKRLLLAIISGVVVFAILVFAATGYRSFISLEGLIIVLGGCAANAFLSYQREDVLKAFTTIRQMLEKPPSMREALQKDIIQLITWSYVVRADDLVGLEMESAGIEDPLWRYGMDLVLTGYPAGDIRDMMHTVAEAEYERRCMPVTVLRNMAAAAPAFGMVGTLVGMVTLLNNVAVDMSNVGGGLALAMLSTLYGLLLARLICLPAADNLLQKEENIFFRNYMIAEGFALLSEKRSSYYVQDKLNSFLEPSRHIDFDNQVHVTSRRQFRMAA